MQPQSDLNTFISFIKNFTKKDVITCLYCEGKVS